MSSSDPADPKTSGTSADALSPTGRFRRLEEIFHQASELEGTEQAEFLVSACADDTDLRSELHQMLGLEDRAESRLGAAVSSGLEGWAQRDIPERVGPYRVLSLLGQGGLGAVYLAERDDEHFHKRVAIKWVRPEMGSAELDRRFRFERQVLASLEHPNIARILDGGTHHGAAFIVMELVNGQQLLDYCRDRELSIRDKLELFRNVCDAVHYAHQNLILHCDLKPSNILVDESGAPKLVDFGIAKALRGNLPGELDGTVAQTSPGARPLTPEYASPEQAQYLPLTTSSDIYSLGVVLYELLSGQRPYRIETGNPLEIAEVIAKTEAPPPSARFLESRGAESRGAKSRSEGRKRSAPWSSDLDAIVAKALRKEPDGRYRSVEQLSEDLLRYLEDRPVLAKRGSLLYPWKKLIRRHRLAVAAISTVVIALALATVVTSHQARVAKAERLRAEASLVVAQTEKERAETVSDLIGKLFEVSDPSIALGSEITAREMLDKGSRQIQKQLDANPELRAPLALTIGRIYRELAVLDQAEFHLLDSLRIYASSTDEDSPEVVKSLHEVALLRLDQDQANEADRLVTRALRLESEARGSSASIYGALLQTQALCRLKQGQTQQAREILERFLTTAPDSPRHDSLDQADAWDLLAQVAYDEEAYEEAEKLGLRGLEARRRLLEPENPKVAVSLNNLAAIRQKKGDFDGARVVLEETLNMRLKVYGDQHEAVAQSQQNLAAIHIRQGRLDEAETLLADASSILLEVYGPDHTAVADVLFTQAYLERRRQNDERASILHRRALKIRRLKLRPGHPNIVSSLMELAGALSRTAPDEAESLYREALALQQADLSSSDPRLASPLEQLANLLCARNPNEAESLLRKALHIRLSDSAQTSWKALRTEAYLGRCIRESRPDEAVALLRKATTGLESAIGSQHPTTRMAQRWLHETLERP